MRLHLLIVKLFVSIAFVGSYTGIQLQKRMLYYNADFVWSYRDDVPCRHALLQPDQPVPLLRINAPLCWLCACVALGACVRACVCVARTQVQVVYVGVV